MHMFLFFSDTPRDFGRSQNAPLSTTLGKNVMYLREAHHLGKKKFSQMCGISRPTLNNIERGKADIRLSYVQRLADTLCVNPISLLIEDEPELDEPELGARPKSDDER